MPKKYNYDYVLKIVEEKNFKVVSDNYKNCDSILTLVDNEGYHYVSRATDFLRGSMPSKFYKTNPYTIQNIRLWLLLNSLSMELLSETYFGSEQKLIFKDFKGYFYSLSLNNLFAKTHQKFYILNPYTIQNIKLWCNLNNKQFELLSDKYNGSDKKLKWKCLKENCGEEFDVDWECIYSGQSCPYCSPSRKRAGVLNCLATKNPEIAKEWHPTKNGDLTPYDVTPGSNKKVWWQCSKNPKHEWCINTNHRANNSNGCPYCSGRYPSEDYNLLVCNSKLSDEWNYKKNKNRPEDYCPSVNIKVWWICRDCGHEWKANILNRNNGNGCPECNKSTGEKRIKEILDKLNLVYDSEYDKLKDLLGIKGRALRFDFCVFQDDYKQNIKSLIEFDGEQHFIWIKGWMTEEEFKTLQYHDKLKNEYCKNNNIKLLRIKYDRFDDIEKILSQELIA